MQELCNLTAISDSSLVFAKTSLINKFVDFINMFVCKWNEQKAEQEQREREAESLYRIR